MLKKDLKKYFGFDKFRLGQEEIIKAILNKKNVLAVMPTGAGKSLCYQLPSMLSETYSIIISPLISLMHDQVFSINQSKYSAAYINSSLDYRDTEKVLNDLINHKIKMLFIAPEKLNNQFFVERLHNTQPEYLFVDEAHCISEWGHNFRPSFRNINNFAKAIGVKNVSGFTATATPEVREDIITQLEFKKPSVFVYGFERENISLNVVHTNKKKDNILKLLRENKTPTIIYTSTRKSCEKLTEFLKMQNINAEFYHAGITTELRKVIQDDFIKNDLKVIVATNAFGMGIDKSNIGMVIHYNIPGSIENLYQEFGRAGRDGKEANTYLYFSEKDKHIQEYLIKVNYPTIEQIKICYDAILDYHRIAVNSISEKSLEIDEGLKKLLSAKSINKNLLNSAINSLEQNGYLSANSGLQINYYFKFLIDQTKLKGYVKKLKNAELQNLIISLVKTYGYSSFNNLVEIDILRLVKSLDIGKSSLLYQLENLNRIGIIELHLPSNLQNIKMLRERVPSDNLYLNYQEINSLINHAKNKLNAVTNYCFTEECRFKFVLKYFGENVDKYQCGKCDNCTHKKYGSKASNDYITEIIIRTLKEFSGGILPKRLIGILTGNSKSQTAKSISTFQSCLHYSADVIETNIRFLLAKKVLKEVAGKLFFDPIEELESTEKLDAVSTDYELNLELFNLLREERNIAAKKFSQNPEIICSNKILRDIAKIRPKTTSELLGIEGFNQRMYNKIGIEILECIAEQGKKTEIEGKLLGLPKHIVQTYKLITKGYSLKEISNLLKLPESILSLQIESIIGFNPKGNYAKLIPQNEFNEIIEKIENTNEDIRNIKKKLSSNIRYSTIRIVKAIFEASASSGN